MAIAPEISLTAVGSGRVLNLARPAVVAVLICFAQETGAGAAPVEALVRARWPQATRVLVVDVVDLRKIPGLFRRVAEGVLASEQRKAVEALAPGQAPEDHVVLVADWTGEVARGFGLEEPSKRLGGVVLAADGRVAGLFDADDYASRLEGLIEAALAGPPASR